jgi:hypothetical protein
MQRILSLLNGLSRAGQLARAAVILAVLCAGGCHGLSSDPNRYQHDPAWDWGSQARPNARKTDFWGASNEARQIERNLGVQ